jgi:hypothetical protein
MHSIPLKRDEVLTKVAVRQRLDLKVQKLASRGGFLRASAPVGRLLRKEHDKTIWFKDEEVPVVSQGSVNTSVQGGFAALLARFGTPKS